MIRPLLFAPLLALLLASPRADELTWHVAKGTTLLRSFERDSQLKLESVSVKVDGQDQDSGPLPEIELEQSFSAEFSDLIEELDDARASRIVRSFTALSGTRNQKMTPPGQDQVEQKLELGSELQGKAVVLEREAQAWTAKWPEDQEGEAALLEGLTGEVDFSAFLPAKAVSADDSWDVEPAALLNFLRPGGRLSLKSEGEDVAANNAREALLDEGLRGKAKATYQGMREEDGVKLAVIAIRCELQMSSVQESEAGGAGTMTAKIDLSYELEGELLWNPAAGHARSASLSGSLSLTQTQERSIETPEGDHKIEQVLSFAGKANYKAAIEPKS